jgi:hypothetical protein
MFIILASYCQSVRSVFVVWIGVIGCSVMRQLKLMDLLLNVA